jgi:myo-inositol-1(or 4)-monophosphatase
VRPVPGEPDRRPLLDLALRAAREGSLIVRSRVPEASPEIKGTGDYVTEVDLASEHAITRVLTSEEPAIPVIGEEEGGARSDRFWSVDPLDGTTNFVHGFPLVGVSIALVEEDRPVVGVVDAPFLGEMYAALRGGGAHLLRSGTEPRRLEVSRRAPGEAVVATGFPFRHKDRLPRYLEAFHRCLEHFEDLRRPGAASLDLAWVAAGVFDGFFELGLSPWDVAAGALLIEEAGGVVSDWGAGPNYLGGDILAGPPAVHAVLSALCRA